MFKMMVINFIQQKLARVMKYFPKRVIEDVKGVRMKFVSQFDNVNKFLSRLREALRNF